MRIGIIADLHEDIIRTKEAIALLKTKKCEKIVCLGDILGVSVPYYGYMKSRNGSEVIKIIKENCDIVLLGNHDLYVTKKTPKSGTFKYPKNWYSLDYQTRLKLSKGQIWLHENNELSPLISDAEIKYIHSLPEYIIEDIDGIKILFSHWIYPDLAGSTKFEASQKDDYKNNFDFMKTNKCIINIAGHSHKKKYFFSEDGIIDIDFNVKFKANKTPSGFIIPCVANGTEPNGVAIFDTKSMKMEYLPLNTKPHIVPDRANL